MDRSAAKEQATRWLRPGSSASWIRSAPASGMRSQPTAFRRWGVAGDQRRNSAVSSFIDANS